MCATNSTRIALVGFGEAGQAFASGWDRRGAAVAAYDIKTDDPAQAGIMQARYDRCGVEGGGTPEAALACADRVFCVVTADQALQAARAAAPHLAPGTLWFDCNSCAPGTKTAAAAVVAGAGGRYADIAVMAPVHPKGHHVPLLVSGPHAEAARDALAALDMRPVIAGDRVGQASAIKMIRSVMIKGFEALTAECFLAARRAGVEGAVLASLRASDPGFGFPDRAGYNLERMMVHGTRRAAEMREVALTLAELDLPNAMSLAITEWQDRIGALRLSAEAGDDLDSCAARILAAL